MEGKFECGGWRDGGIRAGVGMGGGIFGRSPRTMVELRLR